MKAPSITATEMPETPGNKINRYNNPLTPITTNMNSSPFIKDSILKAASNASA